jgi:molecular chaperone GrpE (heat shock protein)
MRDAIKMMESKMTPESVARSRIMAEQEILTIRLAQLREKLGVKQDEFDNFSQTSISRLEKRKDIRISTLIEYLDNLGMGLEIKTFPKKKKKNIKEEVLLRI